MQRTFGVYVLGAGESSNAWAFLDEPSWGLAALLATLTLGGVAIAVWTRLLLPHVLRFEYFSRRYNPLDFRPVNTKRVTTVASLRLFGILLAVAFAAVLATCVAALVDASPR